MRLPVRAANACHQPPTLERHANGVLVGRNASFHFEGEGGREVANFVEFTQEFQTPAIAALSFHSILCTCVCFAARFSSSDSPSLPPSSPRFHALSLPGLHVMTTLVR